MSKETTNERSHSTTNRNFERNQEMSEIKRYRANRGKLKGNGDNR